MVTDDKSSEKQRGSRFLLTGRPTSSHHPHRNGSVISYWETAVVASLVNSFECVTMRECFLIYFQVSFLGIDVKNGKHETSCVAFRTFQHCHRPTVDSVFFAHHMEEIGSTFDSLLRDFPHCNAGLLLSCLRAEFEGRTLRTTGQLYNSDDSK